MLRHRLIGSKLPVGFEVEDTAGHQLRLGGPSGAVVAYLFPGSATSPTHGHDTPLADAEEHRGFREAGERLSALGLTVVGVSSQPAAKLQQAIAANHLRHRLASDPRLKLGDLLDLPTSPVGAGRIYERLTLLVIGGRITQVFYPCPLPAAPPRKSSSTSPPGSNG